MEKAFQRAPYPDVFAREELALRIGLVESRVQVRARIKNFLRKSYFFFGWILKYVCEISFLQLFSGLVSKSESKMAQKGNSSEKHTLPLKWADIHVS